MALTGRGNRIICSVICAGLFLSPDVLAAAEDHAGSPAAPSGSRDGQIDSRVEFRLKHDESLKDQKIRVDVKEGTVTLKGTVATEADRARAEKLASMKSVQRVDNRIEVLENGGRAGQNPGGAEKRSEAPIERVPSPPMFDSAGRRLTQPRQADDATPEPTSDDAVLPPSELRQPPNDPDYLPR